jgi:hypothetical protein
MYAEPSAEQPAIYMAQKKGAGNGAVYAVASNSVKYDVAGSNGAAEQNVYDYSAADEVDFAADDTYGEFQAESEL